MKGKRIYAETAKIVAVVVFYYALCISMGFVTKYFISEDGYNFRFPIFKTGINNLVHFMCAITYLEYQKRYKKENRSKEDSSQSREEQSGENSPSEVTHTLRYYLETTLCSFIGSIDLSISMYTLRQVELAFYTILKSATPVFIVLSGFMLGTESVRLSTLVSILLIAFGTYLVTIKPYPTANKDVYMLVASAIVSGFRWSFIQFIITQRKNNIFTAIRDLCLPTSLFLFIYTSFTHTYSEIFSSSFFATKSTAMLNVALISLLGIVSFFILLCELWIVKETSVLFLSVSAVVKELVIVGISIMRGSTCMTKLNYLGISISIVGIISYNLLRANNTKYLQ